MHHHARFVKEVKQALLNPILSSLMGTAWTHCEMDHALNLEFILAELNRIEFKYANWSDLGIKQVKKYNIILIQQACSGFVFSL